MDPHSHESNISTQQLETCWEYLGMTSGWGCVAGGEDLPYVEVTYVGRADSYLCPGGTSYSHSTVI